MGISVNKHVTDYAKNDQHHPLLASTFKGRPAVALDLRTQRAIARAAVLEVMG